MLADAKRPVILAGGGAVAARQEVRELAERLDAPVATTLNGKGILPESHPLALGSDLRLASVREVLATAQMCSSSSGPKWGSRNSGAVKVAPDGQ